MTMLLASFLLSLRLTAIRLPKTKLNLGVQNNDDYNEDSIEMTKLPIWQWGIDSEAYGALPPNNWLKVYIEVL